MNTRMIPVTDHRGVRLLPPEEMMEPEPGSIVLTEGEHGTAWQRFFSDGLWHSTRGGTPKRWVHLINKRNVVLVYDAEVRG